LENKLRGILLSGFVQQLEEMGKGSGLAIPNLGMRSQFYCSTHSSVAKNRRSAISSNVLLQDLTPTKEVQQFPQMRYCKT
jgi:hypothetical protein